ncbi:hypothetical protein GCM10020331_097330 [Ectobacillus funiculus]
MIVTPTSTHADMIKRAARNGKQIFVEKPLTHTLEEADDVIQVIQEHNVACQVGFMRRFDPAYAEAKKDELKLVILVNRFTLKLLAEMGTFLQRNSLNIAVGSFFRCSDS